MWERMYRSTFLDLGTSWRWVVNFTPRPLYPRGKSPRYPLDRRLGGPQSRSGRFGEQKILDPYWDSNSDPSVVQPVTSRYTDYAIPAPVMGVHLTKITGSRSDDWIYEHFGYTLSLSPNYTYYSSISDLHNLQYTVTHALGFSVFTSRLLATDLNTETSAWNQKWSLHDISSSITRMGWRRNVYRILKESRNERDH
jgi:hypothetical protein